MAKKKKKDYSLFRRLAEEVVAAIAQEYTLSFSDQQDLPTSLVRQWITYEGNATLFFGERQLWIVLGKTPLGTLQPMLSSCPHCWTRALERDWKVAPDDIPGIFDEINRGQSAEIVNGIGIPLLISVDPKERRTHVEPLVKEPIPPGHKRDYHKIAVAHLEEIFGTDMDSMEELACSIEKQWKRFEGNACVMVDGRSLHLNFAEQEDGGCRVIASVSNFDLEGKLKSLGFAAEVIPEVIDRINLGQVVEFENKQGQPCQVWNDPRGKRIVTETLNQVCRQRTPPIVCSHCSAVLRPWLEGETVQTCQFCKFRTSL